MSRRRKKKLGKTKAANSYSGTDYGTTGHSGSYYSRSLCRHWREEVKLLDNRILYASAWMDSPNWKSRWDNDYSETPGETPIDLHFYCDDGFTSGRVMLSPGFSPDFLGGMGWDEPTISYPWFDRSVPRNFELYEKAVYWLLAQIYDGKRVEIGCLGGHGRTGTLMASLFVAQGLGAWAAIEKVRKDYCVEAIETVGQEELVKKLEVSMTGSCEYWPESEYVEKTTPYKGGTYTGKCGDCLREYWDYEAHVNAFKCDPIKAKQKPIILTPTSDLKFVDCEGCNHKVYEGGFHMSGEKCLFKDCSCPEFRRVAPKEDDRTKIGKAVDAVIQKQKTLPLELPSPHVAAGGWILCPDCEAYTQDMKIHKDGSCTFPRSEFPPPPSEMEARVATSSGWGEYDEWEEDERRQGVVDKILAEDEEDERGEVHKWWQDRQAEMDEHCSFPPCPFPFDCNPLTGDCYRGAVATAFDDQWHDRAAEVSMERRRKIEMLEAL